MMVRMFLGVHLLVVERLKSIVVVVELVVEMVVEMQVVVVVVVVVVKAESSQEKHMRHQWQQ